MKLAENVTINELYKWINKTYESNNHISTVKVNVEFDDGANKVQMVYKTPEGFMQDQKERKGIIELLD